VTGDILAVNALIENNYGIGFTGGAKAETHTGAGVANNEDRISQNAVFFNNTRDITNVAMVNGRVFNRSLAVDRIQQVTGQPVRQMRLAVLAACSSGYSENGLWGPDSLVRSLLASGVPNVIASRWDVDSQSTGELFENFYTYLGQGETPAQALRHARIALRTAAPDLLRGRSKRTHPYYWAGFYLTGKAS